MTSDWAQFQALASTGGTAGPAAWRAALDLVRGRPFDGLRTADWTVLEGIEAHLGDAVSQLAIRVAEHHLAAGDGQGAAKAIRRGLAVDPYDERLYRMLLVAADREGNPAGVESAMAELLHLVAPGGHGTLRGSFSADALACVHPETLAAYRAVSRRPSRSRLDWRPGLPRA